MLIAATAARLPRPVPIRTAALTGARTDALSRLRAGIVAAAHLPAASP